MQMNETNGNAPTMSYEQFQQAQMQRKMQEQEQAQRMIAMTGADSTSQQMQNIVMQLRDIQQDLVHAQNQIKIQLDAQQRQLQQTEQKIEQTVEHMQSLTRSPGSSTFMQ